MKSPRFAFVGALVAALAGVRAAAAEESAPAGQASAEALFVEGKSLMKLGRFGEACPRLEQSQRSDPAAGTLLALAYCRERLGQLASARDAYVAAANLADHGVDGERARIAKERAAALEARISTLTFVIPHGLSDLQGFELRLNSLAIDRTRWGAAVPLDQGIYIVEVVAPGHQRWSTTVALRNEGDRQVVVVPPLRDSPLTEAPRPASTALPPVPNAAHTIADRDRPIQPAAESRTGKIVTWSLAVGSALSFGAGTVSALRATSKDRQSNANGHCDAAGCDSQGVALREEALTSARIATALFVVGGVFGGAALTVYLLSPDSTSSSKTTAVAVGYSDRALDVSMRGEF